MNQPLVSIISFCKDRQRTIRRSIESVLHQTYENLEFVVQDGASTDGTLEILQDYASRDARIKLISEPDSGHEEAFWKVLHRCNGDIMGTCLSDEELAPDAVTRAVAIFNDDAELGAITGDGYFSDENGLVTGNFVAGEFNIVDYLFTRYCPFWPGSFFRTRALTDIGLSRPGWNLHCIEFEVWCRLATDHVVKHIPYAFSKYALHPEQLSNTPRNMRSHAFGRLSNIEKMFSETGFFGVNEERKNQSVINQLSMFAQHARGYNLVELAMEFERRIDALPHHKHPSIKVAHSHHLLQTYLEAAAIYERRGQIKQALEMWKAAEPLNDATADALACRARPKLPSATEQDILSGQQHWATRHARPDVSKSGFRFKYPSRDKKIKIGYHCNLFNTDQIRAMLQGVIEKRDATKFTVYGYSPAATDPDPGSAYDAFRQTAFMSNSQFVDLVRRDGIDIFVELSGFSPGNRLAAMASRCAPVQVSYLGHSGTSGVPNVDYLLADDICAPREKDVDRYFTEQIYRLPGNFRCFDYDRLPAPLVTAPSSLARGSVTFGCFANGGKINEQLISYWAALLQRVPQSTFLIKNRQLNAVDDRRFMMDRFRRFGVESDRLRIEGGTDRQSLLKCYADVDVALDTWPYCGGNTTAEAFWQGVPVVTLSTARLSARRGASLVTAAGCSDLVARSPQEYVEIAAKLASDSERLRKLRSNLRTMVKQCGLGDSGRLARALEEAFTAMIAQYWSSQSDARQQSLTRESDSSELNRFGIPKSKMLEASIHDPTLFP